MPREYVLQPFRSVVDLKIDYRAELNEEQFEAVCSPKGPALVIAGAGAGKTRTLIYRVAFLVEQGVAPDRILLLTFTNKAAKEMMTRAADLLGGDISGLWGGTFHAVGLRILRRHADRIGYRRDFTIIDREDTKDVLNAVVNEMDLDIKATRFPKAEVLREIFSLAVNQQTTIKALLSERFDYLDHLNAKVTEVHHRFRVRKKATGVMDFDDLLWLWLKLFRDDPEVLERYQRRFQFLLVDEYQDTNALQGQLIDLLAARHGNVMVVGDDSQSIYSWRGADFQNILQFPRRFSGASVYRIQTNYRSTPEILCLANAAIASNTRQFEKRLTAVRKGGAKPVLAVCADANEQAAFVAQRALELRDEGVEPREMAVLYRSHFHALELQLELTRRHIPFAITSGIRFFEQAHLKDVAAYLRLVVNPREELAFKRLARMLPGVGARSSDKIWAGYRDKCDREAAGKAGDMGDAGGRPAVARVMVSVSSLAPKKAKGPWEQLTATMAQLEDPAVRDRPEKMISLILDAGYDDYLKREYSNPRSRREDLENVAGYATQFEDTSDFLAQLALETNLDARAAADAPEDERIRLSSVHQAKGLEFRVVFVIMLCDGLFPSARSLETLEAEEEERRLFYVAITRAKDELYLAYPMVRFTYNRRGNAVEMRSRFLADLPADLYQAWDLQTYQAF